MPDARNQPTGDASAPPELIAPAVGLLVVVIAVSSILDDTGLVEHPWWVALVVGAIVAALALVARTVAALVSGPAQD